ncbi:MAG TPA: septum formation initiator family protein [Bacteroidota bacterium]|jgi:cell division protein FtsL|nr:septum formation initiator family protein [Bacteroidota bacterium]
MKQTDNPTVEQAVPPDLGERRYVYNGTTDVQMHQGAPRGNRPIKRRKRSPFNIIFLLVITSVLIVIHVWNKIVVNRLVAEVGDLQVQYDKIVYTNEVLRAEIDKKSSLERIVKLASERLGMASPREQPVWFTIDDDRIRGPEQ